VKIALVTPVLVDGDAVSNDVIGMYRALRKKGHDVRLFADKNATSYPSGPVPGAAGLGPGDCCIYHHSVGSVGVLQLLKGLRCRKVVKYHNITPARYYRHLPDTEVECDLGMDQLRELVAMGCEFLADSEFNALDLKAVRPDLPYRVVPPFNQVDVLFQASPDYAAVLPYHDACWNVLMVGRVAPNKNVVGAVGAFARFSGRHAGRARLLVVGAIDVGHIGEVREAVARHGLEGRVVLAGKVTLRQLKAFYRIADALLLVSEHEGFGVPLVEALALRVPVVAGNTTALPYTGGDAARYVDPRDAEGTAAALDAVVSDPAVREGMMVRGWERYQAHFENSRIERSVQELVGAA
jgi:glycosyltransferase involved in cell wall biosynthesis